jgi:hypothetical protein
MGIYLRHRIREVDGKTDRYGRLVRSVRLGRRVVRQTVAHLGELDGQSLAGRRAKLRAA